MALSLGDAVRVEMTKWRDRPHWEMDAVYLGADAAGDWIGFRVGTVMSRPGMSITTTNEQVGLVPGAGTAVGRAWLATFHGPGGIVWTYVDMTTVPQWGGNTVRAVDLDLDVVEGLDRDGVRRRPGRVRPSTGSSTPTRTRSSTWRWPPATSC